MNAEQLLQAGIRAVSSGDMQKARILLARAVQEDPRSDQAWQWLARALPDIEKQRACLIEALRLNPDNAAAREGLDALQPAASPVSLQPISNQEEEQKNEPPPGEFQTDPPASHHSRASKRPVSSIILGILAGALLVSTVGWFLITQGAFGKVGEQIMGILGLSRSALPLGAAATFPPVWTKTPSPLPSPSRTPVTPSPTPLPTATLTYDDRMVTAQPQITRALNSMSEWDCTAAINAWSRIIDLVPEYGAAYYWRAKEMKCQTAARGDINAYVVTMYAILDDINTAIALDPESTGDYFELRYDVFNDLAGTYDLRSDRDYLNPFALDDIQRAVELGSTNPLSSRHTAFHLVNLGFCQQAISEATRIQRLILPGESPSAGIQTALANAYLCERQYTAALASIDNAIKILPTGERRFTRAMALYALGRLNEARSELDDIIAQDPTYNGYRYHLRALIQIDSGDIEAAQTDLLMGYMNSWGEGCIPALAQGLLALEFEDNFSATEAFRYSAATCGPHNRPIWDRALRELAKLDAAPLSTASTLTVTPAPAARAAGSATGSNDLPQPPAYERFYLKGTGRMEFGGEGYITMHLSPAQSVDITRIFSMEIAIEPGNIPSGNRVTIYLLNPENGFWSMYPWRESNLQVIQPERFLNPDGSLYISTMIDGTGVTIIENVKVFLDVLSQNLGRITIGEDA